MSICEGYRQQVPCTADSAVQMDKAAGFSWGHRAVVCPGLPCNGPETDVWENKYYIPDIRNWASSSQVINTRGVEKEGGQAVFPFLQRTLLPGQQAHSLSLPPPACTPGASPPRTSTGLVQPGHFTREPGNPRRGEIVL